MDSIPKIEFGPSQNTVTEVIQVVGEAEGTGGSGSNGLPIILMIAGAVVLVTIIVLVIILVRRKKKNHKQPVAPQTNVKPVEHVQNNCPKPEIVHHSGHTLHLWGEEGNKVIYIYLLDEENEERRFRSAIQDFVTIGRQGADITIPDDTSLSRIHCRIIKRGNAYFIEDLNSVNGTRYDGQSVITETPIIPGGIITIGRHRMRIEIVEETV